MSNEYLEKLISLHEQEQILDVQQYAYNRKCLFDLDEKIKQRSTLIRILKEAIESGIA